MVVAGLNNIDNGLETNAEQERQHCVNQLKNLGQFFKEEHNANPNKKLYLVTPVLAPSKTKTKLGEVAELMRNMETNGKGNVKVINASRIGGDDHLFEDDLHLNIVGTDLLLREIAKHVDGLLRRSPSVQSFRYAKVNTEYIWGCEFCTSPMHEEEACNVRKNVNKKRSSDHLTPPDEKQHRHKTRTQKS